MDKAARYNRGDQQPYQEFHDRAGSHPGRVVLSGFLDFINERSVPATCKYRSDV